MSLFTYSNLYKIISTISSLYLKPYPRLSLIIFLIVLKAALTQLRVSTLADNAEDPYMHFAAVCQDCNAFSRSFNTRHTRTHRESVRLIVWILYNDVLWKTREVDVYNHFSFLKRHVNEACCTSSYFSSVISRKKRQRKGQIWTHHFITLKFLTRGTVIPQCSSNCLLEHVKWQ